MIIIYHQEKKLLTFAARRVRIGAGQGARGEAVPLQFGNVSGQLPIDPATGAIPEGIAAQTAQSLKNIQAILAQQGMTLADVVKTTVFLADMNDFAEMNQVYGEYFAQPFPARSAVQVGRLPKDAPLEIECIAVK